MIKRAAKISKLVELAKSLVGRPYKYGAKSEEAPDVFDCSSFTQYVFKKIGVKLPRTTIEQAMIGKKVPRGKLKAGDLIFLRGEIGRYNKYFPQGIGHVVMYIGNNQVIHAHRTRISGRYEDIYRPDKIKETGKIIIEDLKKVVKREKPLAVIKRYV